MRTCYMHRVYVRNQLSNMRICFFLLSATVLVQSLFKNEDRFSWMYKDRPDISKNEFVNYNLTMLKTIIIDNCKTVILYWNTFTNMTALSDLTITNNEIYELDVNLFRDTWNLKRMNFAHNEIRDIVSKVFKNLTQVTSINLSDNHLNMISETAFIDMRLLEYLDLSENRIVYLRTYIFVNNEKLININLYENDLIYLNEGLFARQYNVKELNLAQNRLGVITKHTFTNMHKLRTLKASQNEIQTVAAGAFDNNTALTLIEMHRNRIRDLESGLFVNAPNLQTLDLGINLISHIGDDVFPTSLRVLKLSGNKLQYMNVTTISKLKNLAQLVLYNNPWRCNCHLIDFYQASLMYEDPIAKTTCSEPAELKGKKWDDLDASEMKCPPNEPAPTSPQKFILNTIEDNAETIIVLAAKNDVRGANLLVNTGDNASFYVDVFGHPWLVVNWYLNNRNITEHQQSASGNYYKRDNMQNLFGADFCRFTLKIEDSRPSDSGEYICHVQNMWEHTVTVEKFYLVVHTAGEPSYSATLIWLLFLTVVILYTVVVIVKFNVRRFRKHDKFDKPVIFQTIIKEMDKFRKGGNSQAPILLENTDDTESVLCIEVGDEASENKPESEETAKSPIEDISTNQKEESDQETKPVIIDSSPSENEPESIINIQ